MKGDFSFNICFAFEKIKYERKINKIFYYRLQYLNSEHTFTLAHHDMHDIRAKWFRFYKYA